MPTRTTSTPTILLVDDDTAAAQLGVTVGTLAIWRSTGRYNLPYVKIGHKVRYWQADIDAWLERRRQSFETRD